MIAIDQDLLARIVAEARLAPSVHNIQPTRVSLDRGEILLHGDPGRRLRVADPAGHDVRLSHGAFLEGLALALGERGLAIAGVEVTSGEPPGPVARLRLAAGRADPLAQYVRTRASWRGGFAPPDQATDLALSDFADRQSDLILVLEREAVERIAALADRAGLHFMRDEAHRHELLSWMRLSKTHPDRDRDGLSGEALAMSGIEAFGAGLVLGPLFRTLDRLGLAAPIIAERGKASTAAAIGLFHRPEGEDPLVTGRAFYRAWLAMEAAGLAACPVSVLVDWPEAQAELRAAHPLPAGRHLVNVFRLGIPADRRRIAHARLPVAELIRSAS